MEQRTECARCSRTVCERGKTELALPACPTARRPDVLKKGLSKSLRADLKEFACQAAIQQFDSSLRLPRGRIPRSTRIEETIQFAKKMHYKRLGLAFCSALRNESMLVDRILQRHGFEVVSVCCKVGGVSKDAIGVADEHKFGGPGSYEVMCNPVTQAEIMNDEGTEFNIVIGLCVGHDSLFLKHADAMSTVLIAKDKVLGHNPAAALRLSGSYYKELMQNQSNGTR
ncbi:MAG: hypothetical protein A4E62_02300 [Syntrophorhabdus sp. PtaU1.Bin002]|nr:MAG: hypothetical protein A4E62_02300 [Syntrophorhabdus sp. PtaU1.Bin002]